MVSQDGKENSKFLDKAERRSTQEAQRYCRFLYPCLLKDETESIQLEKTFHIEQTAKKLPD